MGKGECPACVCKIPCTGGSGATFSPPPFDDLLRYTTDGRSLTRSERGGEIFFLTLSKQPCNSEEEEEEEEREEALTCVREIFGR